MDYSSLGDTVRAKIKKLVELISNPEVEPDTRRLNMEVLFRELGGAIYNKIFDMNAFDFDITDAKPQGIDDDMYYGMAKRASDAVSTGGKTLLDQQIDTFIAVTIAKAQGDAYQIAMQTAKRPQIKRELVSETCNWCKDKVTHGWVSDPDSSLFSRHRDCDCRILTRGYRSRNGLLKNYVKPKDRL